MSFRTNGARVEVPGLAKYCPWPKDWGTSWSNTLFRSWVRAWSNRNENILQNILCFWQLAYSYSFRFILSSWKLVNRWLATSRMHWQCQLTYCTKLCVDLSDRWYPSPEGRHSQAFAWSKHEKHSLVSAWHKCPSKMHESQSSHEMRDPLFLSALADFHKWLLQAPPARIALPDNLANAVPDRMTTFK